MLVTAFEKGSEAQPVQANMEEALWSALGMDDLSSKMANASAGIQVSDVNGGGGRSGITTCWQCTSYYNDCPAI
ncbi:MAG: hypothetical protein DI551_11485 [Micavibrio aeruginosavorus]|uniref:Uncharacterized protein n=1 Tax=Micavibrio aeruginosavorus TaxID=349221 RepID=A0A2W5PXG1_9BACT|nr:MAG: hypothetical protein DI551_11485 [Micavibrio aeruginosavorus]